MRYKDAKLENLPQQVKDAIKESINQKKGLFIYGGTGTGKTYILHALAKLKELAVFNFVEMLSESKSMFGKVQYKDIFWFLEEDHLLIDDVGSEKTTDFVQEFLYLIVNKRYNNMKRTVLTTNLSLEDFRERYGDRILSRISEMCVLLELTGEDRRI